MLRHLVCGSSFHSEEDGHLRCATRTSRRNSSSKWGRKNIKNPYSNCGLDKFSKLMADLDEKRQKIYLQRGSQDIALIRFVNSSSGGFVPVVVKLKDDRKHKAENKTVAVSKEKKASTQYSKRPHESSDTRKEVEEMELQRFRRQEEKSSSRNMKKNHHQRQPSWYMLVVVIIILLFLAIFGRSFAILCTCMGWYLLPSLTGEKSSLRTSMKKKEYVRKLSEKKKTILSS